MSRRKGRIHLAAALAFAVIASGCRTATTEVQPNPSGSYLLVSINGKPLPGLVSVTIDRAIEMLASSVTVTSNHRFSFSGRVRITTPFGVSEITQAGTGSWTLRGALLDMTPDDPSVMAPVVLTWDGSSMLTADDPTGTVPVVMVFRK
jgi:hypothetical protein